MYEILKKSFIWAFCLLRSMCSQGGGSIRGLCSRQWGRSKCGQLDWLARRPAERSWAEEDQTEKEVLLDYTRLVWAQDFLAPFVVDPGSWNSRSKLHSHVASFTHLWKPTIIERTMKPLLLHSLKHDSDRRQRLDGGQKILLLFLPWVFEHSQPSH